MQQRYPCVFEESHAHCIHTAKPHQPTSAHPDFCYIKKLKKASPRHQPSYMHLTLFRKKYFTSRHFRRTPTYTTSSRQHMSDDRAKYLDHLSRWLNYEESCSTPLLADDAEAQNHIVVRKVVQRRRADSLLDVEAERAKIGIAVDKMNEARGCAKSKRVADEGKVSRLPIVVPLPSCARDEGSEEDAGGGFDPNETMLQRVKNGVGVEWRGWE